MKNVTLKFSVLFLFAVLLRSNLVFSQGVAIKDNSNVPNPNAILDVDISTNDAGILIPILTTSQRNNLAINAPLGAGDDGLTVYDETIKSFVFWNGTAWKEITTQGANWSVTGNSTINSASNFIGTVDAQDFVFRTDNSERARFLGTTGNLGINTTNPDVYFHIYGDDTDEAIPDPDDATYSNGTGLFVLGDMTGRNLVMDQNEIMARNNGAASSFYLQNRGGDIRIHYDRPPTTHDDGTQVIIKDDGKIGVGFLAPEDMIHIYNDLPYIRFTDTEGGNSWNAGVYGNVGFQRFQITEYTGVATYRQRFIIKEGGNTGIGTVSPEGLLHIKADDTNNATFIIDADAGDDATDTWKIQSDATSNNLIFMNDVNSRVNITSGGYVGIGAVPQRSLHIYNTLPYVRIEDSDGGNYWEIGNTSGEFRIYESHTDLRFEIEAGGNVGIGTDNPDSKLHVLSSGTVMGQYAGTVAAFQQNGAVGDWARISIVGGNAGASLIDFGDVDKQDVGMLKYDHTDNFLSYSYNDGEILRIEDYGYVGIGKTNPSEKLDVDGAVLLGTTSNTNTGAIRWDGISSHFQGYKSGAWVNLDEQPTGTAGGWTDGGTDVYLTSTSDNVGIGNSAPNEKLEVTGHIRMVDGNQAAGSTMVSDANGTASWSNENDGVKTRVIRKINQGASEFTVWSHPEGIDVKFNPATEEVTVTNSTGDASDYWDIVIKGDATGSNTIYNCQYKMWTRRNSESIVHDLGGNDNGWFEIVAADQDDEKDGFIIHVVYYGDDLNGTVQYWDN